MSGPELPKVSVRHAKGTWGAIVAPLPAAVGDVEATASLVE